MSILSWVLQWALLRKLNLPAPSHRYSVKVMRNIAIPVQGALLLADLYQPTGLEKAPIILVRTPYGKGPLMSAVIVPFTEQGYQVLIQCCRGTGGSGGVFNPHRDEHRDGMATLAWIRKQPWYSGSIATYGTSYLGYTQWAIAREADSDVKAMAMNVTLSNFADMTYAGSSLMLENAFSWTRMMARAQRGIGIVLGALLDTFFRRAMTVQQWKQLPLMEMDKAIIGDSVPFWKDWMTHDSARDPWWQPVNFRRQIAAVRKPISMVAGWYDIFLPWQLRDFTDLQRCGRDVRLTIGPWRHADSALMRESTIDALEWFDKHLHNKPIAPRKSVKVFIVGADEWQYFDEWPPQETQAVAWRLHEGEVLSAALPQESSPDFYIYDPEHPTPSIGGPALSTRPFSIDNRAHETRDDVLIYTSVALTADMDIVGSVVAALYVGSDAESADFFVRLCDVGPDGASMNVTDGYERIAISSSTRPQKITINLWPTAYRVRAGHRLRIQISSGAFPRWARNLGYGEHLGNAQKFRKARQFIYHEPANVSEIIIPVSLPEE